MLDCEKGFTYTWEIENFSLLPHQAGDALTSPIFVVDKWRLMTWRLVLYPKGRIGESNSFFSLFLFYNNGTDQTMEFDLSVTLVSTEPSLSIILSRENYLNLPSDDFSYFDFPEFAKLGDILEKKHLFLPQDKLTLRCHMLPLEKYSEEEINIEWNNFNLRCGARSGLLAHQRSLTLQVENITELRDLSGNASFVIKTAFIDAVVLNISLHFLNSDYVGIEIRKIKLPMLAETLSVKCKLTVVSAHKNYQHSEESTHLFQSSIDDNWHFPDFLKTSNLTRDKYLYLEDTLLLQCEIAFSCKSTVFHLENNYAAVTLERKVDRSISEMVTRMGELYSSGKFCDVNIRAGDETFSAHKFVLSALSPVFEARFDSKEKDSSVVEIEDVDPDTLRRMLAFMYFDDLKEDLSLENGCLLFRAADKYEMERLRRRCSVILVSSLSVASVCDVLVLAYDHQSNFLLTAVYNFICSHTNEIFSSEYWKSFMYHNPKLSAKVMHQILIKKGQF